MRSFPAVGLCAAAIALGSAAAEPAPFDLTTLRPFTEKHRYLDQYETGLYTGGSNEMPEAHRQAGIRAAAAIQPLDPAGQPDAADGRILALVLGHSNCRMYFTDLQAHLARNGERLNPRFEMLNAAVGGQQLPEIHQLQGGVWDKAKQLAAAPGRSAKQVQALFLHTTYHGWMNLQSAPPRPFPETMRQMERDLADVLEHCVKLYPNLKVAYLTCDGLRHYTRFEPHVWQEAFGVKWLIESQMRGDESTSFEEDPGRLRRLPWLCWGPYIWDNTWDQSYFTDGVHPAPKAREIFVRKYWEHLLADPVARGWMIRAGAGE